MKIKDFFKQKFSLRQYCCKKQLPLAQNVNSLLIYDNKFKRKSLLTVSFMLASRKQWNGEEGRHGLRQEAFSYLYLTWNYSN